MEEFDEYLDQIDDRFHSTMSHMRVYLDKRYDLMTQLLVSANQKLLDYKNKLLRL
jgi:hypothetical protein